MSDSYCAPVVAAAGFAETEIADDAQAFMAVHFLMHDKVVAGWEKVIAETLNHDANEKHAASEPPLSMGMPAEAFVAAAEWLESAPKSKPYETLIMALQMLKPKEKAALRERVLAKLKAAEAIAQ